jgi:hypothetical protein
MDFRGLTFLAVYGYEARLHESRKRGGLVSQTYHSIIYENYLFPSAAGSLHFDIWNNFNIWVLQTNARWSIIL